MPEPLRLLIITRSPGDALLIEQLLREVGLPVEIISYPQVADGLAALMREPFDLVMLDPITIPMW